MSRFVLAAIGAGLLVYGLLGFTPIQQGPAMLSITDTRAVGSGYIYGPEPRIEASLGALLIVGSYLRRKSGA